MKPKLYFMGSGEIAVPVIDRLYSSDSFELVGICTQEDKPAGRNKKLTPTPVGLWAENKNIEVEKPHSVNTEEFIANLQVLSIDIILVISFGQILKQPILDVPRLGCINIHASLLPKYRGASPITAAILNGDAETGICFMQMERGLDSGPVFREIKYYLKGNEFADTLEIELGKLSAQFVEEILSDIYNGKLKGIEQDSSKVTTVGKIKKAEGIIDWKSRSAFYIERMIRAYHPWPGASTFIQTSKGVKKIIITSAIPYSVNSALSGRVEKVDKNTFEIGAASGTLLRIQKLIPEGKKEMTAEEFLRGTKVEVNTECVTL